MPPAQVWFPDSSFQVVFAPDQGSVIIVATRGLAKVACSMVCRSSPCAGPSAAWVLCRAVFLTIASARYAPRAHCAAPPSAMSARNVHDAVAAQALEQRLVPMRLSNYRRVRQSAKMTASPPWRPNAENDCAVQRVPTRAIRCMASHWCAPPRPSVGTRALRCIFAISRPFQL